MPALPLLPFATYAVKNFHIGGNVVAVGESARRYTHFGSQASLAASAMRTINDGGFEGSEGDRFKELLNADFPSHLDVTGESHSGVGRAIGLYEGALQTAQTEMGTLAGTAMGTHAEHQTAVVAFNAAEANAARARLTATAAAATAVGTAMIPGVGAATAAAAASAETEANAAHTAMEAARLKLDTIRAVWDGHISSSDTIKATLGGEVDSAVSIIATQARADFDDNPNWLERAWQKTKDWVSDHADVLAAISDIMQIVGSVLLLVPGLQAIGAGLLIAGIGLKALLAATGNASWGEVLFDVVTSLPFAGIAKFAKAGKLGPTIANATKGMGKAASAVKAAAKSGANSAALKMANGASRVAGEAGEKFAKSAYSKITRGGQICFAAEPVDMATGNMVDFTQDINIPGILPLIIDRNANSAHELGRALGSRWVSRMDVHIEILDDEVLMVSPDGALLTFPPAPTDGSEVRADGRAWLLSFADGAYRVRNVAEGITYVFSVSGDGSYVTTSGVEDRSPAADGNSAGAGLRTGSFAADLGLGFTVGVTALVHHTGAAITYSWDQATGQMRDVTRSDGTHLSLVWDHATNRVASIWVDNQQTHPDEAPQRLISYEYDAAGQLIRVVNSHAGVLSYFYDEQGRTAGWRDRNGAAYHYRYDDHGRVTAQVGTGGMFPNILYWGDDTGDDAPIGGTVCVLIETAGDFTGTPLDTGDSVVDTYLDRLHHLPLYQALLNGGLDEAGLTGRGRTTTRDNTTTNWTIPTDWLTDDLLGDIRPTVYRATAAGDVWRIISPEGGIQDTTYTDHHLPATITNAAGATTCYTYDDNDLIIDTTYPDGTTTTIEPGTWGMPVRITDRDGHTTDYQVDAFGMTTAVTTADGATTTYTYDYRVSGITPASITTPDGATTHIDCDNAGRTIAITDPAGRRTSHTLNIQGLVTDTLDPDGNTTRIDYTPEGWPTTLTHPDGTTLTATYDGEGNQLSSTNEMGATTTTTYTVFDKPITTTDATGATTTITYNTQMQPVAITNADGHTWTYTYNLDGNITQQTDYNGIVTTNTTSPDGLVSAVTTPAGTTTTTYNQLGLTTSVEDASGTTLFDYDPVGRLTSITNPAATVTYTRDAYGRATAETTRLASGEETRHALELSATGMVTGEHLTLPVAGTITTGYGRNAAGEITSSTITQHTTATTDDSALRLPTDDADTGRLLAELTYTTNTRGHRATTAIDNLVRTIDIDIRGRITGDHTSLLDSATPGGLAPVAGRDFTWRADSTLTAITDQLRGTTRFTVDAIGRATSATRTPQPTNSNPSNPSDQGTTPPHTPARAGTPAQSGNATGVPAQENYSFTPAGVLASTADGVIDYHNTLPVKVGRTTYTYDAAGRITRTVTKRLGKKPLVHHFFYATGEQPVGFSSSDAPGVGYRYTYDGLGRRVAKDTIDTTTGEVTHRDVFTHTGNQLAAVTTTIDTTDPTRVGEGYAWTTDPATGETHGQIALTISDTGNATQTPGNPAATWSQARVDATFYALVCDLAGAPQELINTTTGVIEGHTTQTLYGKRTWSGRCTSPLLFAGQYEDVESGWAYNRFRYYNPTLGAYNAQDPLGLAPRLASAQGYVDHAAFWVDALGLASHVVTAKDQGRAEFVHNRINHHKAEVLKDWNAGRINMTDGQVSHIQSEHWPREMHRGTALDRELKNRVENDRILSGLGVSPTPQGAQGADFKFQLPESKQETWIDLTTEKQWSAHYNRYGGVEGIGEHLHKATYNSAGYSGPMDIKGKVF